jgi:hypothetical protein
MAIPTIRGPITRHAMMVGFVIRFRASVSDEVFALLMQRVSATSHKFGDWICSDYLRSLISACSSHRGSVFAALILARVSAAIFFTFARWP